MNYIFNHQLAQDEWTLIRLSENETVDSISIGVGKHIVPLIVWQAQPALQIRNDVGIWLENTTDPEGIVIDWNRFPVIALDYPKFTDGRSHSIAYLLRNRLGFKNELRAIGDVLVDQLFYMHRVGFNAFSLRADQKIETALRMLKPFTVSYQGATDETRPLFRRSEDPPAHYSRDLKVKTAALESLLQEIATHHAPAVFANSLAFEDMIVTDVIARLRLPIEVFTLQTGMLHEKTSAMIDVISQHYGLIVAVYTPDAEDVDHYIARYGKYAFYESLDLRKKCCYVRKVKPLRRALADKKAWITGQRAEQSVTRSSMDIHEWDSVNGLEKFNPLRDWTFADVKEYIMQFKVPYNSLHDQGYPSIGCDPCTRAIKPNEDLRAGRWWWEHQESKECGLHIDHQKMVDG